MTVYMFPGQGSQMKGMGSDLFAAFPEEVQQANEVLGYSIDDLCIHNANQLLANTQYTQPALFVVEALAFLSRSTALKPDYCIGHSLGEYSALFAAGCFDFTTGLALVKKRGELMAQASGGGMLAVVHLPVERISALLQEHDLNSIDFANFNSKTQTVLSGLAHDIAIANEILVQEAVMCIPLRVTGAFHSRYMQDAAHEFEIFLNTFDFSVPRCPVISNVAAKPYTQETIKENLVKQITAPVQWVEIIHYLKNAGETDFIEVGPGSVLTRLMAQH